MLRILVLAVVGMMAVSGDWLPAGIGGDKPDKPSWPKQKLQEALGQSTLVFVGKILEADLSDGFYPGTLGCIAKKVTFEVKETFKGPAKAKRFVRVVMDPGGVILKYPPEYFAKVKGELFPRLNAKVFAKGADYLVFCRDDTEMKDPLYRVVATEVDEAEKPVVDGRVFLYVLAPATAEAVAIVKSQPPQK